MLQRTDDWRMLRVGKITGSEFFKVLTSGRRKGEISATLETYLCDLVGEHRTRMPKPEVSSKPLAWGIDNEGAAHNLYQSWLISQGCTDIVQPVEFVIHPDEPLIGCSPDGFVASDGYLEIKCPLNPGKHDWVCIKNQIPKDYKPQVQGGLLVTGRQWCDFTSFDPRGHTPRHQIKVVRVERDEPYINDLRDKLFDFAKLLRETLDRLGIDHYFYVRGAA